MESYKKLLLANKAWMKEKLELKPDFFTQLAKEQKPEFLWIGCSDSRVPAEEITGTEPGELFVHRNIANVVVHTDFNLLSVLQFAVDYLKVKHIIVCGHYGCGGVRASLTHNRFGLLNKWLRNIKDVHRIYRGELDLITDPIKQADRLVELNVVEQVHNLAKTSIVQKAWKFEQRPTLHGWVYGLNSGELKDLVILRPGTNIDSIYQFDFADET
ncbi:MAG: carbonic anhydrase [Bdellovibrionales bacterium CG10_big_fil_rev_8_21_14_0_10_45_34]|nr:MAG: carbonic anhydrase [Bdellovibrionales bacterium CG10_big_fil_rev_8_21_14_0_10_45_34]